MRRFFARGVTILWVFILAGLLLPNSNGERALHSFLKPSLGWLIGLGAVITFLFFVVSFGNSQHAHSHVKSRLGAIIKLLILVLPVPFILAFGKAEYGSDALANRLTMGGSSRAGFADITDKPETWSKDSVYRADLMAITFAPELFDGQRVNSTGMVYGGGEIPEGYLYCFRYVMVCCAADAMPVGVFVKEPDSIVVEKDAWYEVEGIVRPDSLDGYFVVKLDEAVMRPVQKPEQTWLYPR